MFVYTLRKIWQELNRSQLKKSRSQLKKRIGLGVQKNQNLHTSGSEPQYKNRQ